MSERFDVIVIGGGHAGAEAAWAAANVLAAHRPGAGRVALVTADPAKIGVMSCNPAIGGLAKGQLVREIDALGGLMGLATDATGIQFRVLNTSKGPAVHGPRAQCDKHAYAEQVQRMIASRENIRVVAGSVEALLVEAGAVRGVRIMTPEGRSVDLACQQVVLTTGTFMRGLMHSGETQTPGGRFGEAPAVGISASLRELGFELGRLKTGTPPRLRRGTIDWDGLESQHGDAEPTPFSDLTLACEDLGENGGGPVSALAERFPLLTQVACKQTRTTLDAHEAIRANLHRAPMFSGQIEGVGPRYCPSIEDKVVRFADRDAHGVFLEPESLRDDWVYCNGISTSLPRDVQETIVRTMPGCERAEILRFGYAVEYDMVRPHQIEVTGQTRLVRGLYLAGQINGTSGYEEAAAQGLVAGANAALAAVGHEAWVLGRSEAYIGVLMDDLVTKTPVEPYRMFTSRAEHRLLLRADNAGERLTPVAQRLGMLEGTALGRARARVFERRRGQGAALGLAIDAQPGLAKRIRAQDFDLEQLKAALPGVEADGPVWRTTHAQRRYEAYVIREVAEIKRHAAMEGKRLPETIDYRVFTQMRTEARESLARFRPRTFGQAGRLEGITPADLTLLMVLVERLGRSGGQAPR
ncbi:MAG: tRNA uridine-5-carboxymethylaminomethyl(34) synthesis enzyme MnmG [Tepidisphaera sp.]|nr:tRNA uridine-5-carboxymethylaminomethyl(34) synthesis enzyme MnmG [Tepidisphaera sp.]